MNIVSGNNKKWHRATTYAGGVIYECRTLWNKLWSGNRIYEIHLLTDYAGGVTYL